MHSSNDNEREAVTGNLIICPEDEMWTSSVDFWSRAEAQYRGWEMGQVHVQKGPSGLAGIQTAAILIWQHWWALHLETQGQSEFGPRIHYIRILLPNKMKSSKLQESICLAPYAVWLAVWAGFPGLVMCLHPIASTLALHLRVSSLSTGMTETTGPHKFYHSSDYSGLVHIGWARLSL